MANDNDNVIVIDGYEGTGKSNLGLIVAKQVNPEFDAARETIFSMQDWNNVFDAGDLGRTYVMDEAGSLLFSRDYASLDSKFLIKLLMQARILRSTIILCLPNMFFLDRYVRESRVQFRAHMEKRTSAMIQRTVVNWRTGEARHNDMLRVLGIPSARDLWPEMWTAYEARKRAAVRAFSGDHTLMLRERKLSQAARIKRLEAELG